MPKKKIVFKKNISRENIKEVKRFLYKLKYQSLSKNNIIVGPTVCKICKTCNFKCSECSIGYAYQKTRFPCESCFPFYHEFPKKQNSYLKLDVNVKKEINKEIRKHLNSFLELCKYRKVYIPQWLKNF